MLAVWSNDGEFKILADIPTSESIEAGYSFKQIIVDRLTSLLF